MDDKSMSSHDSLARLAAVIESRSGSFWTAVTVMRGSPCYD